MGIVRARFVDHSRATFEELISGYSSMRVLTYSSSISIVDRVARVLEDLEVIFGREDIIRGISPYFAFQRALVEGLRTEVRGKDLLERKISSGNVRFLVVTGAISHEKLFLLKGERGTRVITGSANFSELALSGNQNESFICFDNDEGAWERFGAHYERIKADSTMSISKKAVLAANLEDEDMPLLSEDDENGGARRIVEVREGPPSPSIVHKLVSQKPNKRYEGISQIIPKQNGVTRMDRGLRHQVVRYLKSKVLPEEENREYLEVDLQTGRISLSGEELNLTPPAAEVERDAGLLSAYFRGYEHFRGDAGKLARDYFTFMSWLYAGPFACELRNRAQARGEDGFDYPLFGILYGKSNCGKSLLVKTLLISMFEREGFLPHELFTRTRVAGLREQNKRYPPAFDDLDRARFNNHAAALIKEDHVPSEEYPIAILSMNAEQDTFATEIRKRALIFYTNASLPVYTGESRKLAKEINRIRRDLGNALYREYLRRATAELSRSFPSDLLKFSSEILRDIFAENTAGAPPPWCQVASIDEHRQGGYDKIRAELLDLMRYDPDSWSRDGNRIVLRLNDTRKLKRDIPDDLISSGSGGNALVFDANDLRDFLGDLPPNLHGRSGRLARLFKGRR